MNDIKSKLIVGIEKFEEYAFLTDRLFVEAYQLKVSPLIAATNKIIPRSGTLSHDGGLVNYRFHGNGCSFTFEEGHVVDFNYSPPCWGYEGLSLFKFWTFIKDQIPEIGNKDELEKHLNELEESGLLIKVKPPYTIYRLVRKPSAEPE